MSAILDRMAGIVGAKNIITDADAMVPYLKEWRDLFRGKAQGIVRPGSTAEVAELVKLAAETGTVLVPQGGNTGLVGGQIPISEGRRSSSRCSASTRSAPSTPMATR